MNKNAFSSFLITICTVFILSGCSTLQESFSSQMEVPTVENQVNRVAIGMSIVRENNIMAYKIPISSDASWPAKIAAPIDEKEKRFIEKLLKNDPYYATAHYTKLIQRRMLGSGAIMSQFGDLGSIASMALDQSISPLTYRAIQKISIFYGTDTSKWPNVFSFDTIKGDFLEFRGAKLQEIDSPQGDIYETLGDALISLAPVNLQKDLESAREDMLDAYDDTASLEAQKGDLETELKTDTANKKQSTEKGSHLSPQEIRDINEELALLKVQIEQAKSVANEKESIYFTLLDSAIDVLQSDIDIDDEEYVKLAKNINIVANEIESGAVEAYASFGLALTNLLTTNALANFPRELASLAIAKAQVPMYLQSKYNKRVKRLAKNVFYLLPNIFIGTYYASKQIGLAKKYQDFTDVILEAYNTNEKSDKAQKAAMKNNEKDPK